jgi:hypothetical protein
MITGTISADDYLAAQRLHRARIAKWSYMAGAAGLLFGLVVWLLSGSFTGILFIAMGVGALLGEFILDRWLLPRRAYKLHQQHRDFAHPFTYSWTSDAIEARGISGQSHRPWTTYHKVRENEQLVLLYHSDNLFEMFPKRWFSDASALKQLLDLARSGKQT